jgi:hypothetical protein
MSHHSLYYSLLCSMNLTSSSSPSSSPLQLEVYRLSSSALSSNALHSRIRELENSLTESRYETRKSQILSHDMRGEAIYHIRVFLAVKGEQRDNPYVPLYPLPPCLTLCSSPVPIAHKGPKGGPDYPFIKISSDGVSIKVTDPGAVSAIAMTGKPPGQDAYRKYMCDKAINRTDQEQLNAAVSSVAGDLQYALNGHYCSLVVYGKVFLLL